MITTFYMISIFLIIIGLYFRFSYNSLSWEKEIGLLFIIFGCIVLLNSIILSVIIIERQL